MMDNAFQEILPDLIVNACPLGCNQECAMIWTNKTTGHRIICNCPCKHKKRGSFRTGCQPEARAIREILSSSEERTCKR
jgi:hypothetical protein